MSFRWAKKAIVRRANPAKTGAYEPFSSSELEMYFDPEWYLSAYPDIAAAGFDPWEHFERHGRQEGRLPFRNQALAWESALWRGAHAVVQPRLERLLSDPAAHPQEVLSARWALAQWAAWQGQPRAAIELLAPRGRLLAFDHPSPALLAIDIACRQAPVGRHKALAQNALAFLQQRFPGHPDTPLAETNLASLKNAEPLQRLAPLNQHLNTQGLDHLKPANPQHPLTLDNLTTHPAHTLHASPLTTHDSPFTTHHSPFTTHHSPFTIHHSPFTIHHSPTITVIIPLYNAQATIETALLSLFAQQGVRLEIIVVDDASTDESVSVVQEYQAKTPSHVTLQLIRHEVNQGAYAARNTGLVEASGAFITTHDSDDWSHPQKLALQNQLLSQQPELKACLSHWVRVTPTLLFHRWRLDEYGWVYPNLSSLMFRREVVDTLGYWDNVSVNADTEYRQRIEAAFGAQRLAHVLPGVPLSFGRADEGSLSQHQRSHLAGQFTGLRFDYMQAAGHWHTAGQSLYMPLKPPVRPFVAPRAMLRDSAPRNPSAEGFQALIGSKLFDAGWYLERYIDLQKVKIEPLRHFWELGAWEGRDPGPDVSTSGYVRAMSKPLPPGVHPLAHYLAHRAEAAELARPVWPGAVSFENRPTVMLCAHQAGATLFGAERSLLDVMDAMKALRWNVVVTLPEAGNEAYEQAILARCKALAVLPYGWWQVGRTACEATVGYFQALIERFSVSAVHGNTAVLQEPYVAARRAGITALVHVRELPHHDSTLCELVGAKPSELIAHVHAHADIIVANSRHTARTFRAPFYRWRKAARVCVVPNTFDMAPLLALPVVSGAGGERLRVGMLSSNVAKKGFEDLEAVAQALLTLAPEVDIVVYGPATPLIDALKSRQALGKAPSNIHYAGYVASPAEALATLDLVLNLSRFQESFGRTVLEAMAAAKPVVAYRWGALPELIVHDNTGYCVPFADTHRVAHYVVELGRAPRLRQRMGQAGRARAEEFYSAERLKSALARVYRFSTLQERPF